MPSRRRLPIFDIMRIGQETSAAPQRGFTLLELMMVLTLAAVIMAIGAPSFGEFSRNNRLSSAANNLLAGLQLARTEAIKLQTVVSICSSDNPDSASPTCSPGSFRGWIVFADGNADCQRTAVDPLPLRSGDPLPGGVGTSQDASCASFYPNGYVRPTAGQPLLSRVVFCDSRGLVNQPGTDLSVERGVELTPTGRAVVTREAARLAGWNLPCTAR